MALSNGHETRREAPAGGSHARKRVVAYDKPNRGLKGTLMPNDSFKASPTRSPLGSDLLSRNLSDFLARPTAPSSMGGDSLNYRSVARGIAVAFSSLYIADIG